MGSDAVPMSVLNSNQCNNQEFGAEVRAGMAEREAELNDALGFGDPYPDEVH